MNELIEKLISQSMEPSGLEGLGGPYMELDQEKFAKLVVQECIEWSIKEQYIELEYDAPLFREGLKKHFGIKE